MRTKFNPSHLCKAKKEKKRQSLELAHRGWGAAVYSAYPNFLFMRYSTVVVWIRVASIDSIFECLVIRTWYHLEETGNCGQVGVGSASLEGMCHWVGWALKSKNQSQVQCHSLPITYRSRNRTCQHHVHLYVTMLPSHDDSRLTPPNSNQLTN